MSVFRWLLAWALAALVAAGLGSIVQTQFNLARIAALDGPIPFALRLQVTASDLLTFAPIYLIMMALGMLIALTVAAAVAKRFPQWRGALFALAGLMAVAAVLGLMNAMLPVTVIGAARTLPGFIALCLPGALGGWLHQRALWPGGS